ncbi:MAG: PIN domain-containing protein [Candidatus Kapabacteria bacterium]|jgi:predicted nucleic acid-binding protein|nr:PIN domain-containing protein [Candidatus Kapabacteria bacterium]
MKVVVDTNIVFSAILNSNSNIGNILLNSSNKIEFYSVNFLKSEINKHIDKISKITKRNFEEINEITVMIYPFITFISEELIPKQYLKQADKLTKDIDFDDVLFIALSLYFECPVWTGDKALINKLNKKGFNNFVNIQMLNEYLIS